MNFWFTEEKPEPPYPWLELFKGIFGISLVLWLFRMTKERESVIYTAFEFIFDAIDVVTHSMFRLCEFLANHLLQHYWLPVIVVAITWYVFPEIVDDIMFLIHLGFKRYLNLFF